MRREVNFRSIGFVALALGLAIGITNARAEDDWEAVGTSASEAAPEQTPPSSGNHGAAVSAKKSAAGAPPMLACGEAARPASGEIQSMIAKIDQLWGVDFRAYETVALEQPHSAPGGCILYNRQALAAIMFTRLDVNDPQAVDPLLWAIFAHEVGHELHHDFESSRASISAETKELEADRFAGYTLQKLRVPATDLTPFWTMAGDDFGSGAGYKHGSSAKRVAAFKQGWHLAEWRRPENSVSVESALDEPVAPDDADSAPR